MAIKARLTPDDLWRLGEGDTRRELVNGEIIEMGPAGGLHGMLLMRLGRLLSEYADEHGVGRVLAGDVGFVLNLPDDPDRVRAPDIAIVRAGPIDEKYIDGPPELAVEILSPSESPIHIQQKIHDYLEAGTRVVWIVAPQVKTVTVYKPDGSARLLREHEVLEGDDILPGLSISLAEIFRF